MGTAEKFTSKELIHDFDRRHHSRVILNDEVPIAFWSNSLALDQVVDISMGGLMYYSGKSNQSKKVDEVLKLDIACGNNTYCIKNIPYKRTWHHEVSHDNPGNPEIVLLGGICFIDLSPFQKSQLDYLLEMILFNRL